MTWLTAASEVFFPLVIGGILLVGLVLTLTPIISGLWLMWAAALVYGIVVRFDTAGWIIFGIISVLAVVGGLLDNIFMAGSSRRSGASWLSIGAALLGAIIGSILLPPFGGLLLAVLFIFLAEYLRVKDWRQALESTKGLALGCGWAAVTRFGFGLLILIAWLLWVLVF